MDKFCGNKFWDSNLTWYTEDPDLTPCFQNTVLVWAPCAFLWIWSTYQIYTSLHSFTKNIPWNALNMAKVAFSGLLILIQILELSWLIVLAWDEDSILYSADYAAPVVKLVTFGLVLFIGAFNRYHGVRSSAIVFLFWFLLSICEAVAFRAAIRHPDEHPKYKFTYMYVLEVIYYPIILGQLLLNFWADAPPSEYDSISVADKPCPESGSSFPSRIFFLWFEKLVRLGYKKPLELEDLWNLNPEDTCQSLNGRFQKYWKPTTDETVQRNQRCHGQKKPNANVLLTLAKVFGGTFLISSLLSFLADLVLFTTPQVLDLLVGHVSEGNTEETWKGYAYAVLLFIAGATFTLLISQINYYLSKIGMRIRTVLFSVIYAKTVRISNAAREESTAGEIVNFISVDVERLVDLCPYIDLIWSCPMEIGLSLYFLWQILGPSVLAGMGVLVLIQPATAYMTSKQNQYETELMELKDKRIKLMNEILAGIKVLKLYAWEPSFEGQVMEIRAQELKVLRKTALLSAVSTCIWTCAPFFVSAVTFATYVLVDENNVLDARKAFVSLSLFNIMRIGITMFPNMIVFMVQARVSLKRINKFLNAEEIRDDAVSHDPEESDQVSVQDGNFSWKKDNPGLRDINFSVKESQLVAIVGSVGAGKSTLLSALLGEVDHKSGHVHTKGQIAYVAQQPWIQNATVRDNILFGHPIDGSKYEKVMDACALRPDLEILPAGDATEIGEKGINLSGGQKQRVALARAAYNHADLYLFDDPLSAVDSHVAKHLFEHVIGPKGLLKGKTRLLVTHGITFLPQMDNILVIADGEISEQGTYKELLAKKGAFADFLIQHIGNGGGGAEGADADTAIISDLQSALGSKDEFIKRKLRLSSTGSGEGDESGRKHQQKQKYQRQFSKQVSNMSTGSVFSEEGVASLLNSLKMDGANENDRLIEAEEAETGTVKLSVVLAYMRAVGVKMTCSAIVLELMAHVFLASSNFWLSLWADDNEEQELMKQHQTQSPQATNKTDMYIAVYVALGVGQAVAKFVGVTTMAYGCLRASTLFHNQMLRRILRAPMWFFDTTPLGRIVNRFGKDVDTSDTAIPNEMSFAFDCIFQVFVTLLVICYVTPIFVVIVLPLAAFYFFAQRYYIATSRQLRRLESITLSPIFSHFGETLSGTTTIRAFRMQDRFITELERKINQNQATQFPTIVANRFSGVTLEMTGNLIILCAALLAVWSGGSLSAGLVGLSVTYSLQITETLNLLVRSSSDVETNLVSVERLKEYTEVVQEAEYESKNMKPPRMWPESGEVAFEKYQTRYREGLDLILHDVTCKIAPGEKIGIVGRTGAGKSSLTLSLFRLIEAAGGSIKIDGVDISKLGLHDVRRRLTIIPQDPIIFSGSLRLNLDPLNEKTDEHLWRSLELAHLKPFVTGLDGGLSYELTEGGDNLSVGQRQLVCLARALLRKSKILVLDEATAAIDLETDDIIQDTIRKEFADCTILTIAHRLNTIMDYGRVMVLDRGHISEFDTPENLLRDRSSIFYGMAKDAGLA